MCDLLRSVQREPPPPPPPQSLQALLEQPTSNAERWLVDAYKTWESKVARAGVEEVKRAAALRSFETATPANDVSDGATASDAQMSSEVGGKFSMFSGSVEGENVSLTPFDAASGKATIVWKWRFATWQPNHYSTVTLEFNKRDDGSTSLELSQVGVPEEERERTEKGWKGLLLDRLKAMLGGSVMG